MPKSLPPYSTYRADPQQPKMLPHAKSFGNVLTFTPPGFKQALNVKFPDSRLPVCVSCKKNFKTKDMCRVRNAHTRPPWTTAYICMTLDDSCTDEHGKYVDKPFVVRMMQWRPFIVMEDFPQESNVPVCTTCKKTNRTRNFCRVRHKHRKLPWCTVYVMLSTQESVHPSTVVAAPSTKCEQYADGDAENNRGTMNVLGSPPPSTPGTQHFAETTSGINQESSTIGKPKTGSDDQSSDSSTCGEHDINKVPESRTMLIQINDKETKISWLKQIPDDETSAKGTWGPRLQSSSQEPETVAAGIPLIQTATSAQAPNYSYPPVVPTAGRVAKRPAESVTLDTSQDVYRQQPVGGYHPPHGHPVQTYHPPPRNPNEPPQHVYHYPPIGTPLRNDPGGPSQYSAHPWAYSSTAIPPHPVPHANSYVTAQWMHQRPISPAPPIGSPGGSKLSASLRSPSVTAGEAAAMRRKKPRQECEAEDNAMSQPDLTPPPRPPVAMAPPQQQQPIPNYGQVPLAPGPPAPTHQQSQYVPSQIHQEQQQWMVYPQVYHTQVPQPPLNHHHHHHHHQYSTEASRVATFHTPESSSRTLHHQDESPNNVTMTPGPGDGGGDHDSAEDETDFNDPILI